VAASALGKGRADRPDRGPGAPPPTPGGADFTAESAEPAEDLQGRILGAGSASSAVRSSGKRTAPVREGEPGTAAAPPAPAPAAVDLSGLLDEIRTNFRAGRDAAWDLRSASRAFRRASAAGEWNGAVAAWDRAETALRTVRGAVRRMAEHEAVLDRILESEGDPVEFDPAGVREGFVTFPEAISDAALEGCSWAPDPAVLEKELRGAIRQYVRVTGRVARLEARARQAREVGVGF
jgi:hypothetical protein